MVALIIGTIGSKLPNSVLLIKFGNIDSSLAICLFYNKLKEEKILLT